MLLYYLVCMTVCSYYNSVIAGMFIMDGDNIIIPGYDTSITF